MKHDTGELDGTAVCRQLGIQRCFYVSAKTGENVEEAFEYLIKQVSPLHTVVTMVIMNDGLQVIKSQQRKIDFNELTSKSFDLYDSYSASADCCCILL